MDHNVLEFSHWQNAKNVQLVWKFLKVATFLKKYMVHFFIQIPIEIHLLVKTNAMEKNP